MTDKSCGDWRVRRPIPPRRLDRESGGGAGTSLTRRGARWRRAPGERSRRAAGYKRARAAWRGLAPAARPLGSGRSRRVRDAGEELVATLVSVPWLVAWGFRGRRGDGDAGALAGARSLSACVVARRAGSSDVGAGEAPTSGRTDGRYQKLVSSRRQPAESTPELDAG